MSHPTRKPHKPPARNDVGLIGATDQTLVRRALLASSKDHPTVIYSHQPLIWSGGRQWVENLLVCDGSALGLPATRYSYPQHLIWADERYPIESLAVLAGQDIRNAVIVTPNPVGPVYDLIKARMNGNPEGLPEPTVEENRADLRAIAAMTGDQVREAVLRLLRDHQPEKGMGAIVCSDEECRDYHGDREEWPCSFVASFAALGAQA